MSTLRFAATLAIGCLAFAAQADATCTHPAMARAAHCSTGAGIDPNTFLVQPPATTRWLARGGHANADHPAVAVARMQRSATVDPNTFLVQPPVAVSWTVETPTTVLAATPATVVR